MEFFALSFFLQSPVTKEKTVSLGKLNVINAVPEGRPPLVDGGQLHAVMANCGSSSGNITLSF